MKAIRLRDGVEVEVIQLKMFSYRSYRRVRELLGGLFVYRDDTPNGIPGMKTADGWIETADNDFVVKDSNGYCSVCNIDEFTSDYGYVLIESQDIDYQ